VRPSRPLVLGLSLQSPVFVLALYHVAMLTSHRDEARSRAI